MNRFASLVWIVAVVACKPTPAAVTSQKGAAPEPAGRAFEPRDIAGRWDKPCDDGDTRHVVVEPDGSVRSSIVIHLDATCRSPMVIALREMEARWSPAPGGSGKMNVEARVRKLTMIPLGFVGAATMNKGKLCGVDWREGVAVDVTGKDCDEQAFHATSVIYGAEGLYFAEGAGGDDLAGTSTERRLASFGGVVPFRRSSLPKQGFPFAAPEKNAPPGPAPDDVAPASDEVAFDTASAE